MTRPKGDLRNDARCGFQIVTARDIDRIGIDGIVKTLKERVHGAKVYVSVDIDVLDPAFAPGQSLFFFLFLLLFCWNLDSELFAVYRSRDTCSGVLLFSTWANGLARRCTVPRPRSTNVDVRIEVNLG